MNKEELIGKLHMIYAGNRNALEEMIGYYDGLKEVAKLMQQENIQLRNNKNKALEYINDRYDYEQNVLTHTFDRDNIKELYEILGGNND